MHYFVCVSSDALFFSVDAFWCLAPREQKGTLGDHVFGPKKKFTPDERGVLEVCLMAFIQTDT